jgi:hypothetical protein
MFALLLATSIATAPVPSTADVLITTSDANQWIGSTVDVVAWNRQETSVDQDVSNGDQNDVRPDISHDGNSVKITAVYTGTRKAYFFGLIHANWNKSFHWTVHVPADRPVHVTVENGRISVSGVTAPVDARTSNGKIKIDGSGPVLNASTSNGSIDATVGTLAGAAPQVSLHTSNGSISLHVPHGFTAHTDAHTENGSIRNPLGSANGPGTASLRTSNGSIEVVVGS